MTVDEAYATCRDLVRRSGSTFYYGMRLLPQPKREAIYTLYAWSRLADDAVDGEATGSAHDALGYIGELLERALDARYRQDSHPVVVALGESVRRFHLPERCFRELLAGMLMDLEAQPFDTFDDLLLYCQRVAGTIGELCLEIFGYHDESARPLAVDLGVAMQLTNILRDLEEDWERGRVYLPLNDFEQTGYSLEALSRRERTASFRALMAEQAHRAHAYYAKAGGLISLVDADAKWSTAMLYGLYKKLLSKIESRDYDVFGTRIGLSTMEKTWMAASLLWKRRSVG
ncbi:MAG: phytoene/squalene synthase family protein [Firmicutes bacterium]|nr:phytoene/squalene synthase family protein [Bacillota bacterium]